MRKKNTTYSVEKQEKWRKKSSRLPSEVRKLVADVLPAFVNLLEQEIDDDVGE